MFVNMLPSLSHVDHRIVHTDPLSPRRASIRIRTQQDLSVLGNRPIHPLELEGEQVEVGSTLGKLDIVLFVVATGVRVWQ